MPDKKAEKIRINGMTCTNCALGVRKHLEKLGMGSVHVNFMSGEAFFDNPKNLNLTGIRQGIRDLGYEVVEQDDENRNERASRPDLALERLFLFSLILTLPLVAHMFMGQDSWLNKPLLHLILGAPVYVVGSWYFGRSAWNSLKIGIPNMDALIFIGSSAAFGYSLYGSLRYWGTAEVDQYLFFETAATIITLVLLGNLIEKKSVRRTADAIESLRKLQKKNALAWRDGSWINVPVKSLMPGDRIRVRSGEQVPVDGRVISGDGNIDESMLTGESAPIFKSPGASVLSGTLQLDGSLEVEMERKTSETVLSGIIEVVKEARRDQPAIQKLGRSRERNLCAGGSGDQPGYVCGLIPDPRSGTGGQHHAIHRRTGYLVPLRDGVSYTDGRDGGYWKSSKERDPDQRWLNPGGISQVRNSRFRQDRDLNDRNISGQADRACRYRQAGPSKHCAGTRELQQASDSCEPGSGLVR